MLPWLEGILVGILMLEVAVGHDDHSLLLVQVLHRHGPRGLLPKDPYDLSEPGEDPPLLAQGVKEMRTVGQRLRLRYLDAEHENSTGFVEDGRGQIIRSYSSDLTRTIMSAEALLSGLVDGGNQSIAVRVFSEESTDYRIRGYTKCPVLDAGLEEFYRSEEYTTMSMKSEAFRKRFGNSDLKDWFDTYDKYVLQNRYQLQFDGVQNVSDADLATMTQITRDLEFTRYGPEWGAISAEDGLVSWMVENMRSAVNFSGFPGFVEISAHYPTMISVLSALDIDPASSIMKNFPEFGAAMLIELHQSSTGGSPSVRFFSLPGPGTDLPGVEEFFMQGKASLTLDDLETLVNARGVQSSADWCKSCQNTEPPLCPTRLTASSTLIIIGLAIGLVASVAVFVSVFQLRKFIRSRREKKLKKDVINP